MKQLRAALLSFWIKKPSYLILVAAEEVDKPGSLGIDMPFLLPRNTADYVLSGGVSSASNDDLQLSLSLKHRDGTIQGGTVVTLAQSADREYAMAQAVGQVRESLGLPVHDMASCRWSISTRIPPKHP